MGDNLKCVRKNTQVALLFPLSPCHAPPSYQYKPCIAHSHPPPRYALVTCHVTVPRRKQAATHRSSCALRDKHVALATPDRADGGLASKVTKVSIALPTWVNTWQQTGTSINIGLALVPVCSMPFITTPSAHGVRTCTAALQTYQDVPAVASVPCTAPQRLFW